MRNLGLIPAIALMFLLADPAPARADVGLGVFVGDPAGLDLKLGLARRSSLDLLVGWDTFRDNRAGYFHATYLVTPVAAEGRSVVVPLRLGIGGAVFGPDRNNIDIGVRAPLEVGLMFRNAPLELYGEIALLLTFHHPNYDLFSVQGGIGLRFYF